MIVPLRTNHQTPQKSHIEPTNINRELKSILYKSIEFRNSKLIPDQHNNQGFVFLSKIKKELSPQAHYNHQIR